MSRLSRSIDKEDYSSAESKKPKSERIQRIGLVLKGTLRAASIIDRSQKYTCVAIGGKTWKCSGKIQTLNLPNRGDATYSHKAWQGVFKSTRLWLDLSEVDRPSFGQVGVEHGTLAILLRVSLAAGLSESEWYWRAPYMQSLVANAQEWHESLKGPTAT